MRFPLFAVRPQLARAIFGAAVEASAGRCFGEELTGRRRSGLGVLSQMFRGRDADFTDGWGPAWQGAHLAVVHTGTRSLVTCVEEVDAASRLAGPLEAGAREAGVAGAGWRDADAAGLRILTVAHFFSWFFVGRPGPRRAANTEPSLAPHGATRVITDPRDVLTVAGLASKAPTEPHRARGPWRVYSQADDGRVRPARGTVEPVHLSSAEESVTPVEITGMVPTGGSPFVPGWGHAAVVSMTPIVLDEWRSKSAGDVRAANWSWVATGATNLRREDLWRHDVHEHADRMRLPTPFQSAAVDVRWWRHSDASTVPVQASAPDATPEWKRISTWSDRG